jgi:hypothetical protein
MGGFVKLPIAKGGSKRGGACYLLVLEESETTHDMGSLQKLPLAMGSIKGSFCKLPIAWVVSENFL